MVTKANRGRPRLYAQGTKLVAFRAPIAVADAIVGAIAQIKLSAQEPHLIDAIVVVDALKARLRQLENVQPAQIRRILAQLDRAVDAEFKHVQR